MSILLVKQSRCTERETVKCINYRHSERASEKTWSFQKTFFIIPKQHASQIWQVSGWLFLPETTAGYQNVSPITGLHHQHTSRTSITPGKQVHHPQKPEGCAFDGHQIQSQWLVTITTAQPKFQSNAIQSPTSNNSALVQRKQLTTILHGITKIQYI